MKTLAAALAVLALAAAGCGGSSHPSAPKLDTARVDAVISQQVRAGLASAFQAQNGGSYTTTASCISTDSALKRFKCTTTVTNDANEADYSEPLVNVTCEQPGANCVWQVP